jgi:hypothetical protein
MPPIASLLTSFDFSQAERNELEKRFDDVTNTSDPTTPTPAEEEDSGADSDQDSANEENM